MPPAQMSSEARAAYDSVLRVFQGNRIRLPLISELANPASISADIRAELADIDPDSPHPLNLFRVHWYNDESRTGLAQLPGHLILPSELTGVKAKIIVALGNRFPMVAAHKVLPAYGCLVPRLVSGGFDPARHRSVWPSTGNYCRGGVAIARILGCRGVAVLPEGMSRERFDWLEAWVGNLSDIVRTPGSESNVKEIYDACAALAAEPENVILNQFGEFANYIIHRLVTGPALEHLAREAGGGGLIPRAFVAASGSGGTLAAGDHLKAALGTKTCVVEALECPTLLYNGYGEHNIQGIGDKHVPLIHNVMAMDYATAVSDAASDSLLLLFNTEVGRDYLARRRGVAPELLKALGNLGISSIANIVAAIKLAKYMKLGEGDSIVTVATDGAAMYGSEREHILETRFHGLFDAEDAAATFGRYILGAATDHLLELTSPDRERMFNLGYYTWVEQQGVCLSDFDARRKQSFWDGLLEQAAEWDARIDEVNRLTGVSG
jgi:cysteine synthase A